MAEYLQLSRLQREEFVAATKAAHGAGSGKTMTGADATRWMAAQGD